MQNEVYIAQAELASPNEPARYRIEARHVQRLEKEIDASSEALTPQNSFVLSHGFGGGAQLHVARTVARRAERVLWALNRVEPLRPELLTWMNRLGDLLFALALEVNRRQQVPERSPDYSV